MSATIYWQLINTRYEHLSVCAPSLFIQSMTKAFGNYPWILGTGSLSVLRGMAAACDIAPSNPNPYEQMIEKIETDGGREIEVWPEY